MGNLTTCFCSYPQINLAPSVLQGANLRFEEPFLHLHAAALIVGEVVPQTSSKTNTTVQGTQLSSPIPHMN